MLSILPIGGYALFVLAFVARGVGRRSAVLAAATVWGVVAVVLTEALSLVRAISAGGLAVAWLVVDAAVLAILIRRRRTGRGRLGLAPSVGDRPGGDEFRAGHLALLVGVGVVLALVGVTAVVSPPNTWDAMQYHMPRLVYWVQNRSVAFFATHDMRHLFMSPGAEFLMLQLHALGGGDRLDNLVQWGAYAVSVVGVTLIAHSLGAGVGGQVLASVIAATIPQGILEASGAKNDWVVALWLVALTYYLLGFRRHPSTAMAAAAGAALGLACLTKGSAVLLAPPLAAAVFLTWPTGVMRAFLRRVPIVLVLVVALIGGHSLRNYALFDTPVGPAAEDRITAGTFSVSAVVSTVIRNAALHFGTPSASANDAMTGALERVIRALGADPNDPRTTWFDATFRIPGFSRHEALAGNPVHLVLIGVTLACFALARYRRRFPEAAACAAGLLIAFLVFCVALRWQPWHSRLHLPLFVLWAAPIGVVLGRSWPRMALWSIGPLLLCLSIPFVIGNSSRPLAWPGEGSILRRTRTEMYFAERADVMASFRAAAHAARETGCRRIGLARTRAGGQHYEYPLLVLLRTGRPDVRVSPIGVGNVSSAHARASAPMRVCAVVCLACAWNPHAYPDESRRVWSDDGGQVFLGSWPVAHASVRLSLSERRVRLGQPVTVGVDAQTSPAGPPAELVIGVIRPDRRAARLFDPSGTLGPPIALDGSFRLPPLRPVPPGFSVRDRSFAHFALPVTEEDSGRSQVFVGLVRQGTADRGRFDDSDLFAWDVREFVAAR